jgi:hypothetical protein
VPLCASISEGLAEFLAHLRAHIGDNTEIMCPFVKCKKVFSKKSCFSAHLTRFHNSWDADLVSRKHFMASDVGTCRDNNPTHSTASNVSDVQLLIPENSSIMSSCENSMQMDCSQENDLCLVASEKNIVNLFMQNIGLFYLKLQAKFFIPVSTIQLIITEFQDVNSLGQMYIHQKLTALLLEHMPQEQARTIVQDLSDCDLLHQCNSDIFNTAEKRRTFYEKNFKYNAPRTIYLGSDNNGKPRYCQYVPIVETLKNLVKQCYHLFQKSAADPNCDLSCQIFEDISDGKTFKANELFSNDHMALQIMLYQDSFEIVNPLGYAKHKILGVYFTLANLPAHYRSNIDHIQLVLLCREEDTKLKNGMDKALRRLMTDLKYIETTGIVVVEGIQLKGSVISLLGDNLGSHVIGGFTANFSTSQYFCRYCLISRSDFHKEPHVLGKVRDPDSYNTDAEHAAECDGGDVNGVKFKSTLCCLQYYHVCQPGLPPCLGHDLFEGVVPYDMALYLKYFVRVKHWFSYKYLNHQIATFQFKGSEAASKPKQVNESGKKLNGHAAQNWSFLRLFPLFVFRKISDTDDVVWQLCLQLKKIAELVCAPKISSRQVACLQGLLNEYLVTRQEMFPDDALKPKHHFLSHYPGLIVKLGPLIRLWTMRFESKHTYFKRCARSAKNFKNVCKTLARSHQLLQAYYSAGSLFADDVSMERTIPFSVDCYSDAIKTAVSNSTYHFTNTCCSHVVIIKGTEYRHGDLLVIREGDVKCPLNTSPLVFGKVLLILQNTDKIFFVVEEYQSIFDVTLQMHYLTVKQNTVVVSVNDIADYYPLHDYSIGQRLHVPLHHSICFVTQPEN